jgi:hypothetical protein
MIPEMQERILKGIEAMSHPTLSTNSIEPVWEGGQAIPKQYDEKGKGEHYQGSIEVIDMMVRIWGVEKTILWCEMTIFKYRMRIGKKDKPELELTKIKWYEEKIKELKLS